MKFLDLSIVLWVCLYRLLNTFRVNDYEPSMVCSQLIR